MGVLSVWGVADDAEIVYRALLRNPERDLAALADHLQRDPADVRAAMDSLVRAGLAQHRGAGLFDPSPPTTVLAALLRAELIDLEDRRARLDAVRVSLSSFAADHLVGRTRGWAQLPFELLSDDEARSAVEDLQRGTTGEVLSCHRVDDIADGPPAYLRLVEQQLGAGRPMRAIYPVDVFQDEHRLAYVRRWATVGEEVRLVDDMPPEFAVFGQDVALISSEWEGAKGSKIVLHAPAMVAVVRELFECYWAKGRPLRRGAPEAAERPVREILELLMVGAKDEAMARQLGVSLRTIRRRVAALMDELGAGTRFQAGMEAVRRGLL